MVARKMRVQDIVSGNLDEGGLHTALGDADEVRLLGTIVDAFLSSDGNYGSLTLDDGTETLRLKGWGEGASSLKRFGKGDLVEVLGKPRLYNDEVYVVPDIMVRVSPNRWVAHELEILELQLRLTKKEIRAEVRKEKREAETFDIFEEDDYVQKVFETLSDKTLTKKEIIYETNLDDIDVELALRQLLDDGRIELSGGKYRRTLGE